MRLVDRLAALRPPPFVNALPSLRNRLLAGICQIDAVDPSALALRVEQPVLIVQGGRDASVRPHQAERLATARSGKPTATALFPDLQHMYKPVPEGLGAQAAFGLKGPTDPGVSQAIDAWIRQLEG